jgi:hypothetical protein
MQFLGQCVFYGSENDPQVLKVLQKSLLLKLKQVKI